ncbi:MAG: CotH kinase family protein [Bacteroidales bacterium]|nr:CotH kinase family protein [Bacteroidales bacterium]
MKTAKKPYRFLMASAFVLATVFAKAQETRLEGMYGIDHEKKIIVATGKLPDGAKPYKETMQVRGETYTCYRSEMPIITITTDGPIVNTPAVHGTISVADANGHVIEMHAGFKIRGTSSQQYDKKSYRVELWADATGTTMMDTTFLGMRSDDDWNLEAMWAQPLRLRDKVANNLWMEMHPLYYQDLEPDALSGIRMEYADVFINGSYVGVYALTERMDRKQLNLKKFNGELRGLLYKGNGSGAPTFESLPAYDNTLDTWDNYEWVYPNEDEASYNWSHLYSFTNFVMNSSDNVFNAQYAAQFDKSNAVDYFLFINALMAMDNMGRNLFLARYKKTGPYFYLPWDLDAVLGLNTEGNQTHNAEGLMSNGFFDRLINDCNTNGYVASAKIRYNTLRNSILNKNHIMQLVQNQYNALLECGAYDREHEAWPDFTVDESQLDYLADWLDDRFNYLDDEINSACGTWDVDEVIEDQFVEVFPNPAKDRINIQFTEDREASIRLYDMMGRLVYSYNTTKQSFSIPTHGYSKGIYMLLINVSGKQQTEKVVVE